MLDSTLDQHESPRVFAPLFRAAAVAASAARAATGRKVVGYVGVDVPVELIAAAELLPFRIGVFEPGTSAVQRFLEMGDSDVVGQLANVLLDGSYDFLDHVIIGNTPTFNITLFHFLRESRRLDSAFPAPSMTFHEIHHGQGAVIEAFNVESCQRLAQRLGSLGSPITDASLHAAIEQTNARRQELWKLQLLRRQSPPAISGTEALSAFAQWQMHVQSPALQPAPRSSRLPRIMLSGSDIAHFAHYPIVEATGCTIVADDHDWGEDPLLALVENSVDPMTAIARRYAHQTPRAQRWSRRIRIASVVERAVDAQVDGVVFWICDEDQASSWDIPALRAALDACGIQTLDLGPQPVVDFDAAAITAKLRGWLDAFHAQPAHQAAQ
jgi:benzoyl-CoA reductase/2-hydroxyglutaryl-CoA dehydratase subunit BcrC/BadD/HgdB